MTGHVKRGPYFLSRSIHSLQYRRTRGWKDFTILYPSHDRRWEYATPLAQPNSTFDKKGQGRKLIKLQKDLAFRSTIKRMSDLVL